jgi:hypothetical protein
MIAARIALLLASALGQAPAIEPEHAHNLVYQELLANGVELDGLKVRLPAPTFHDGQSAEDQRKALRVIAGSDRGVEDLLRDSPSAPHVLKVRPEQKARDGTLIRGADLWFVIRADLDKIDPNEALRQARAGQPVEAGNMRFETRVLTSDELKARCIDLAQDSDSEREWYTHSTGRLLDRIEAEATSRSWASRSANSMVVASRTVAAFDDDRQFPNRWRLITQRQGKNEAGPSHHYSGGASYVKISQLQAPKGALVVEIHFVFAEPKAWFDGAPILRSKFSLVAQNQIRSLRRELSKRGR